MISPEQTGALTETGWFRVDDVAGDPVLAEVLRLRQACADEFTALMTSGRPAEAAVTTTGQYGFTADGDESAARLRELRSHLVVNQTLPTGHPLAVLAPTFYGEDVPTAGADRWSAMALRLHRLLDLFTMETMEALEERLGLAFGTIAGPLAMGERLLRFQWYPALPDGPEELFMVETDDGVIPVRGRLVADGERRSPLIRVGPHKDMGHWTWQVYSTDSKLRFWDRRGQTVVPAPRGDWLYGNVCDFLEAEHPGLPTPIHWVDADRDGGDSTRMSISYFAHVRPGAAGADSTWGAELYRRLATLGYATDPEVRQAIDLLHERGDDRELTLASIDWEATHAAPPGFAVGTSRYYRRDEREPGGLGRRTRAEVGGLREELTG
ncbi:hypothetical protein ACI2K4_34140 [Micromonospora sp. NPDC050397]|uniref:hypothetical protein n=1 Tax=Micromonospora sp. NPDC050397 TaxID=3364279 RepID=UPI00384C45AD